MRGRARGTRLRAAQLFALSIGLLVLFAIAGFAAGNGALDSLSAARRRVVDRIDPALAASQRFLIAMTDQEDGLRDFSQDGEDALLAPYRRGVARAPRELK